LQGGPFGTGAMRVFLVVRDLDAPFDNNSLLATV
jgi:hypothetical protein